MSANFPAVYFKESKLFSDPQSVTVATVAKSLPRVGSSLNTSKYATADRALNLSIVHTDGRRRQDRVRLDNSKVITDPMASDRNLPVSMSVYLVVDTPPVGYNQQEVIDQVIALADWLKATGNAAKFIGGES